MVDSAELTTCVKAMALEEGFARVGVTSAEAIDQTSNLHRWLELGWNGDMDYMVRNTDKRENPSLLVEGARSVLCMVVGYAPACESSSDLFVARYARGRDYHKVLKKRCRRLMARIGEVFPGFSGRAFTDSAPVMERTLAAKAGLGWIGRNGCLIVPGLGSYVLLCEIISNLPLETDSPHEGSCGECGKCVKACPTGALDATGLVDCRKCMSYLTIEQPGIPDKDARAALENRLFGCDSCQEVCPHNRDLPAGDEDLLFGWDKVDQWTLEQILVWNRDDWEKATQGKAIRRASYEMLLRNAIIAAANSGRRQLMESLDILAGREASLHDVAAWAVARLRDTVH